MVRQRRSHTVTQNADSQALLTPGDALQLLVEGNKRFVARHTFERNHQDQVSRTAAGQYPFAFVLGCVDSRVPPEIVFDQGIGDIFSARVAGNFVNGDILGSMEFGTAVAGSKVIMILGHTQCGAVKGACDEVELGHLTATLRNLAPAISAANTLGSRTSANKDFVNAVARANVLLTVQNVLDRSAVISDLVARGKVLVVGAMYDVATGRVTLLES